MNLPKLVFKTLGRSERLSKKYIKTDFRNHVVETTGKIHKPKWFKGSLNATERLGSLKTVHYVNDKLYLRPLNVYHCRFQDQVYFKLPDTVEEYLWINYLIKNEYQVIAGIYNHDDGVVMFTVPNWDIMTVNKCDMKPYYVLCSVILRLMFSR